jgi:hypothetical protein
MILYGVVPYLLVAAPPVIVLLSVMLGGCAVMSTTGDRAEQTPLHSDPDSRAGGGLTKKLERREVSAEFQRIIDEAQR